MAGPGGLPREHPTGNWQPEQSHGTLTIWFHEHLAFDGADATDLPEPGDVDDLPLWGGDSVAEPRRLLTEVLQDQNFGSLRGLDENSETALENFLSQRMLQGTPHLQRSGGVFSPTLLDEDGNAIGMLELTAVIEPGRPMRKSADGKSTLETWFSHTSSVDRSAKLTSGLGIEASGGPSFTTDHAEGHPNAASSFGGNLMGKAGANWQLNDQLNNVSSATLMYGLRTKTSHLLTSGRVTYTVTLHRAGGGQVSSTFGPWEDGLRLRIARRAAMAGHRPGPEEVRALPEHLENLDSIGYTETPSRSTERTRCSRGRRRGCARRGSCRPPAPGAGRCRSGWTNRWSWPSWRTCDGCGRCVRRSASPRRRRTEWTAGSPSGSTGRTPSRAPAGCSCGSPSPGTPRGPRPTRAGCPTSSRSASARTRPAAGGGTARR